MYRQIEKLKKLIAAFLIVFALAAAASIYTHNLGLVTVRNYINSFGDFVPLVLLILIILTSSIGFIFTIPVAVAAFVMDIQSAFAISIIGLAIGAMISFLIARGLGRKYIEREFVSKMEKLRHYDEHLKERGFITVLFFRLMPLVPYEIVNLAAGFSRVGVLPFFIATVIGIIPGTLITIYIIRNTGNLKSSQFLIATTLWAVLCLSPLISKRMRKILFG